MSSKVPEFLHNILWQTFQPLYISLSFRCSSKRSASITISIWSVLCIDKKYVCNTVWEFEFSANNLKSFLLQPYCPKNAQKVSQWVYNVKYCQNADPIYKMPLHKSAVSCFVDCQRLVSFSERERHEPVCSIANRFSHLDLLSLSSMSSIQRKDFNKFHQCSPVSWFCQIVLWIFWNHMICNIVSTLVISGDFTCKAVMEMRNRVKCDHII